MLLLGAALVLLLAGAAPLALWKLPPSPRLLPIGAPLIPVTLLNQEGAPVALATPAGPMLLVVFRGVWCPYCRGELARLAEQVRRFSSTAIRVYGISGDEPEALLRERQSQELPFTLLSDPDQRVASLCKTSMHCLLLFDGNGILRWGGFTESWRRPPPYQDVLEAAHRLE
ncbi:MAG TPA: peroxiredoxin family protein [Polyangiaceae bacterium]|nr:peroxiredoxin family protein [Polyangiaceae bacterium]